jgi:hypothetical protein
MNYIRRLPLLASLLGVSSLYFPLNQLLTSVHNLKTALDAYIPVVPIFVIPYLFFIPYWIVAFLYFASKMDDRLFRALMIGSISAVAIASLVYVLFPTYTDRPMISIHDRTLNCSTCSTVVTMCLMLSQAGMFFLRSSLPCLELPGV